MADDTSLGGLAKRWLRNQTKGLLTTDNQERRRLEGEEWQLEKEMKEEAGAQAVYAAVPGLEDWKDRQEANRTAAEADRERRRVEEVASRPLAGIGIAVSGDLTGHWAGQLPARVETRADTAWDAETGEERPGGQTLLVELTALDHDRPVLAGMPLLGWTFAVPDYTGPGTYDINEIVRRREEEGGYVEYTEWCLGLGSWDEPLYWDSSAGPSTVEIGPDGRAATVRMTMSAAWGSGPTEVVASVNLP
jgi:hypothetical protein